MQLLLEFLELSPPQGPSDQLDAQARADAIKSLARIIAHTFQSTEQMETSDE
jgi:hypothetical protein